MQKTISSILNCQLPKSANLALRLLGRKTVHNDVWAFLLAWGAIAAVKSGLFEGVPL